MKTISGTANNGVLRASSISSGASANAENAQNAFGILILRVYNLHLARPSQGAFSFTTTNYCALTSTVTENAECQHVARNYSGNLKLEIDMYTICPSSCLLSYAKLLSSLALAACICHTGWAPPSAELL